jgi:hypothetical protein
MKLTFLSALNSFLILIAIFKLQKVDTSIINKTCGQPEVSPARITRIINGFEARPNSWPVRFNLFFILRAL